MTSFNQRLLRGGFCWFCASRAETSFANDPNPNSFNDSQNLSDYSPKPQYETYLCELCGNDVHYGYDCPPQLPLVYKQEPCYNQNFSDNYYPHNSSSFLCCDNCRGPHESFQCQSMNQNYFEPNPCYEPNSFSFDQIQPSQQFVNHQPQEIPEVISFIEGKEWIETKNELYKMMEAYTERMNQQPQEKEEPSQNSDFRQLIREVCGIKVCEEQKQNMEDTMLELLEDCRQKELYRMHNDVEDLIERVLKSKLLSINLKSQRLDKDKHEVKNIVEHPTKHRTRLMKCLKNFKVIHNESIIPLNKTSQISSVIANTPVLPIEEPKYSLSMRESILALFCKRNRTNDDKSLSNEDVLKEIFRIYSNHLYDEEIISTKIDSHYFNVESNLIESLLNRDTLMDSSPNLSLSPIPVKDSDSQMEEIDLFLDTDDLMPQGIENDDYDSEWDIHFLEELLSNDPFPLLGNESSNFDHHNNLLFPRLPPEPPDVEIFFDFEHDTGVLTTKVVEDISEHYVLMPKVLPSQPTLCPNIDTLLLFSSKNEDKVFKPSILSYLIVSHRDKIIFDFSKNLMIMIAPDLEESRARGFVHRPLEFQSFALGNPIS
nr:hypothetical protein [Tanacetum cinerariifolium]